MCSISTEMPHPAAFPNLVVYFRRIHLPRNPAARRALIIGALWWTFLPALQSAIITAISPSFTDVLAAVASAARGDTVAVPQGPGSVIWLNTLPLTKGIFLSGPGRDNLTISCIGACISVQPDATAIQNEEIIRIQGFTFNGPDAPVAFSD